MPIDDMFAENASPTFCCDPNTGRTSRCSDCKIFAGCGSVDIFALQKYLSRYPLELAFKKFQANCTITSGSSKNNLASVCLHTVSSFADEDELLIASVIPAFVMMLNLGGG